MASAVTGDIDINDCPHLLEKAVVNRQSSVFTTALPYAVGFLALGVGAGYVAVTSFTTGGIALPIAAAVASLIGASSFFATTVTAIYAKDSDEFHRNLIPVLKVTGVAVITEVVSIVARSVIAALVDRALYGPNNGYNRR